MFFSDMYRELFTTPEMREIWSEKSTVSAWLVFEKTLAEVQAEMGLIPSDAAKAVAAVCLDHIDFNRLAEDMGHVGRPIVGFVRQLREQAGAEYADYIHFGTTTQDIIDTATMLQVSDGLDHLITMLRGIISQLERIEQDHLHTKMIGRTNGQYARPITFGFKAGLWRNELERRLTSIVNASKVGIQIQFGGPVGILDDFQKATGQRLKKILAERLGMRCADLSWQNTRDGLGDIILALGQLSCSIEKIGQNINLLSSSDIGELYETPEKGKGASSSMAHKNNQRCSEFAEALGKLARGRSVMIFETSKHFHERSGGAWLPEWIIIPEVFLLTSGALKWTTQLFTTLNVNQSRMLENLSFAEKIINPVIEKTKIQIRGIPDRRCNCLFQSTDNRGY